MPTAPTKAPLVSSAPAAVPHRKVFVAVAAHFSAFDRVFVESLAGLMVRTTVPIKLAMNCDPSVERSRNMLTQNFLESDCTHILFIDSDIGFSAEHVARICSHEHPVVGGLYPLKNTEATVQMCGNRLDLPNGESASVGPDGLVEVKYIGTGFLCIARAVFLRLIAEDGPAIAYLQDFEPRRKEYAFWRQGVMGGRFLTEDWLFCHRWRELGGQIYADTQVVLSHAGRAVWPLPFQQGFSRE